MSARFPGARGLSHFWRVLRDGVDAVEEALLARAGGSAEMAGRWGAFLDGVDLFDASFFGISPREAARMDPQQRLALEAAWDALDDGGHPPVSLRGTATGVFLGVHRDEYGWLVHRDPAKVDLLSATGGSRSGVAARISYALGLEGPSLVVDTDRSSSLVAVHLACESLRREECTLALAGGVNLLLTPELSVAFERANMLARDGRIKFCDARADGIVRSDGLGMVVLKTLSAAERDDDRIYALILGGASNHDGGRSGDPTTPSRASQTALLQAACDDAGVSPLDVQYVEAHGTGTVVGDPVEVEALAAVLQRGRTGKALRIGSVKTNVGHAEAAAGIAGLIKVALAVEHRCLPASLHFETPNPNIAFDGIVVQREATEWPDETRPLLAGVTSLGLTGVNAHVVVGEAPRRAPEKDRSAVPAPERAEILVVSARGRAALLAHAKQYVQYLRAASGHSAFDIARAAATRRSHLEDRIAVVGRTREELARELENLLADGARALLGFGGRTSVDVGARPGIEGSSADVVAQADDEAVVIASLALGEGDRAALLRSLATLYMRGVDVDWKEVFGSRGPAIDLPAYPWQRERYWCTPEANGKGRVSNDPAPDSLALVGELASIATPRDRRERARELVTRALAKVLGRPDAALPDLRRSFRELGVTSLLATELATTVGRAALGWTLPSPVLFNHPNVEALAEYLAQEAERGSPASREVRLVGGGPEPSSVLLAAKASASAIAPLENARPLDEPVAVIGMGCRFPGGADSPDAFWKILRDGVDAIREVPSSRWDLASWYHPDAGQPGKMRSRWGGFVDGIDRFDAAFFGISPREAEEMDPQHRMLLEVSWEALERAGQMSDDLLGSKTGIFVGLMNNVDYVARKRLQDDPTRIRAHHGTGTATSIAAGRLAYLLGATGPAMVVDTACSSSLVAVRLALSSLRSGECNMALVGGANAIVSPELTVAYSQAGMLSPTGRCRTFDVSADGYVRSEGCGVLVLKRLSDAVANGDNVLAVLVGSAVNQDGRSSGLTAPNGNAQRAVVEAALADAGLTPADVDYVEAHGTGTPLGDPIEFQALGDVFKHGRSADAPLRVGSVKTNVGHMEAAAGVAGLIKVILSLRHREIVPHLHLQNRSPLLMAESYPVEIPTRRTPWSSDRPRVAGVSSFGFSGTNAHVVVAEAPPPAGERRTAVRGAEIVVVSAKSEEALGALVGRHAAYLEERAEHSLGDVAFTLARGRVHHEHRLAVVASTRDELALALAEAARGRTTTRSVRGKASGPRKVAWLFTGQGAQQLGMGRELAAEWPVFAAALEATCRAFDGHLERPLEDVMWAEGDSAEAALIHHTVWTQPAMFALEVALAALWRSWGVEPDIVAGHSVGELAAAHVAGVFSLEDAARLVAARARLMQALDAKGAMFAISASEAEVSAVVASHERVVAIAAVNGPASVVISGDERTVVDIAADFARRGTRTVRLPVSHAFHSPHMDPMLEELRAVAATVRYRRPEVAGVGNVDGAPWGPEVMSADYWVTHVRAPVRFADGVRALYDAGARTFLELGPMPVLTSMVPACLPDHVDGDVTRLASMRRERFETEGMFDALAGFYATGGAVHWSGVFPANGQRVELPTYPWQRASYWLSPPRKEGRGTPARGLLGSRISVAGRHAVYESVLSVTEHPWLADHRVGGDVVVPAAAWLEVLGAASDGVFEGDEVEVRSVTVRAPLRLVEGETYQVQVIVDRGTESRVAIHGRPNGEAPWTLFAEAELAGAVPGSDGPVDLVSARARCSARVDVEATYAELAEVGLGYGGAFRCLREMWRGENEVVAHVVVPEGWASTDFDAHPALLDGALQAMVAGAGGLFLPFAFERVRVLVAGVSEAWAHVRYASSADRETIVADVTLSDASGRVIATLSGCRARRAELGTFARAAFDPSDSMFRMAWRPLDVVAGDLPSGRWLIVGDDAELLAERVRASLGPRGTCCTHVDASQIVGALPAEHVVCAWNPDGVEDAPAAALRLVGEALAVVKALAKQPPARVWWLTRGAMAVTPTEQPLVAASASWGLVRTWMLEHPELGCTLVDLPSGDDALDAALAELSCRDSEQAVAWRDGRRYGARLERAPIVDGAVRALRTDGTVLVTGGLGGIGRHVARWLAQRGVRHVLLSGRRGDRTPGAEELVTELRALGAEVTVAALDVTDREAVAAVLSAVPAEYPLRGIVHAAGELDDGVLAEQTPARFARVMGSKTLGAWHLDAATRDVDLDVFVMFSSVTATLGSAGQAPYAAANAFLDALAAHRHARGLPATSLAWGPWADVGMTSTLDAAKQQRWEARGMKSLAPSRALSLLDAALGRPDALLVLVSLDIARARQAFEGTVPSVWRSLVPVAAHGAVPRSSGAWVDELRALPPARQAEAVLETVLGEIARALALTNAAAVRADRPLVEAGLDSLLALELRSALARRIGRSLPATLTFDYPTPSAIAKYLVEKVVSEGRPADRLVVPDARTRADEPIAIVGFGCRFPGDVNDGGSFWRLLEGGIDAIGEVPRDRWDVDAYYDPDPAAPGKMYTREGGFLAGIDQFEPEFFEISPREAVHMDPQQRLLLETSWEALEQAAIAPASLASGNVGVFVGVMSHEYMELQGHDLERRDGYVTTGSLGSVASGRLSYALGLRGPSMTIDTACSSSLVATHLACSSLRSGECDLALAGGATVVLTPSLYVEFSRLRGLSRDGRCKSFDAAADGVSWSEGCGVLVLKRLSDAQRDGDRVLAVVVGSAVNQDGRSQGLTAPNGQAQQELLSRALSDAKLTAAEIDYVEAHGTGTKLGDPIEMQALGAVMSEGRDPARPIVVGSLKSNVGHTQAAAGVGGIIKTILALEHELIPRSLHFHEPSPHIPWAELPVRVASEAVPWKRQPGRARRAGVSGFGISGTNAHVVLEEAPPEPERNAPSPRGAELLVLSATSEASLVKAAADLSAHLRARPELRPLEVAATLARGRMHHAERIALVARSSEDAVRALEAAARGEGLPRGMRGSAGRDGARKLAWMFTGQGSQWPGMGRGLAEDWPIFRDELQRVCDAIDAHLDRPIRSIMWGSAENAELLARTQYTQPALFALQVALSALWRSWGVTPDVVMGHSVGELAAAYVAGVFSLEDAARFVVARGRLMEALPAGGAMVSIAAPEALVLEAVALHGATVSVAAVNGPESVVISGAFAVVDRIADGFARRGVRTSRLAVSHAFHSPLMDPMLDDLRREMESMVLRRPSLPLVSNVTGAVADDLVTSPGYWVDHARREVRFAAGVSALRELGVRVFVELGPKPTLLGLVTACVPKTESVPVLTASMRADRAETESVLEALGTVYAQGRTIDWAGVFPERTRRVELPTYPWQRKRYWVEPIEATSERRAPGMTSLKHPLLHGTLERPDGTERLFTGKLSPSQTSWLDDHRVHGTTLFPGTGSLELALAVGRHVGVAAVASLTLVAPMPITSKRGVPIQIWLQGADPEGRRALAIYAGDGGEDGSWTCCAKGMLAEPRGDDASSSPAVWPPPGAERIDLTGVYERLAEDGLQYGVAFRGLVELFRAGHELFARVALPEPVRHEADAYAVHPALLDAALHALAVSLRVPDGVLLPFEWQDVEVSAPGATELVVRFAIEEHGDELGKVSFEARDPAGVLAIRAGGLVLRRAMPGVTPSIAARRHAPLFSVQWEPAAAAPREIGVAAVVLGEAGGLAEQLRLPRVDDLPSLDRALEAGQEAPTRVIVDATRAAHGALLADTHDSVHRALTIVQGWLAHDRFGDSELVLVTRGAVAAVPSDAVDGLGKAALWGLVRSVRVESPHRRLRLLDVDPASTSAQIRAALGLRDEPELALRGGSVLAPHLDVASPVAASSSNRTWLDGTVLVTGGTGALGTLVARHLAASCRVRRIVLVSRRGADAPGAIAFRDELAGQGVHVTLAACDVGRREELARLLKEVEAEGPLRAVFHCAGVVDDGAVRALDAERFDRVFGPKVDAAVHLHELTQSSGLDAFVLFSSVAGVVGTAGQASYAAANSFLDALAAHRAHQGLPGQSLAWGLWESTGTGMAATLTARDLERIRRRGIGALSVEEGLELFDTAIERSDPVLVPARLDLSELQADEAPPPALLRKLVELSDARGAAAPSSTRRSARRGEGPAELRKRLGALHPAEQRAALLDLVRTEVAAVFRLPKQNVRDDQALKSFGLDSIMALELRDRLGTMLQTTLPATLAFDHPTPEDIVRLVHAELWGERAASIPPGDDEAVVRRTLATLPLDVLRRHGLLDRLLELASGPKPAEVVQARAIDELSNEELAALVKSL